MNLNAATLESLAWGKTHYFDAGTRRWFGSRFADFEAYGQQRDGRPLVVTMIESVQPPSSAREYRPIIFDVATGRTSSLDALGAPTDETLYLTRHEAKRRLRLARGAAWGLVAFLRRLNAGGR